MLTTRVCHRWILARCCFEHSQRKKVSGHFWRLIQESRRGDRMDLQENYSITVRMYKVEKKITNAVLHVPMAQGPVSHIGLDTVNTAQKAVGPEGQLHVCRRETRKKP
jgi:hypothetical protein